MDPPWDADGVVKLNHTSTAAAEPAQIEGPPYLGGNGVMGVNHTETAASLQTTDSCEVNLEIDFKRFKISLITSLADRGTVWDTGRAYTFANDVMKQALKQAGYVHQSEVKCPTCPTDQDKNNQHQQRHITAIWIVLAVAGGVGLLGLALFLTHR